MSRQPHLPPHRVGHSGRHHARRRTVLGVIALVTLVAVGIGFWLLSRRPSYPPVAVPSGLPAPRSAAPANPAGELITTPSDVTVGPMTPACRRVVDGAKSPWKDAARGVPVSECVDSLGRPMIVQFCSYVRLPSGELVPTENTRDAPRCRAELAELQASRTAS